MRHRCRSCGRWVKTADIRQITFRLNGWNDITGPYHPWHQDPALPCGPVTLSEP